MSSEPVTSAYPTIKRVCDVIVAAGLAITLGIALLAIAVAIRVVDGRPVLFWQTRIGRRGRPFRVVKFRTVRNGNHDPHYPHKHLTVLGGFLRRFALDELPQLWNVLRGDMSLVGPRPVLPDETAGYTTEQQRRLTVRPGLTGWAQVNGRNALDWRQRVELDVWYVDHVSFLLDLRILFRTVPAVMSARGVYGPGNIDPTTAHVAGAATNRDESVAA